ncbi:hypothetical protein [Bacillus sp. HMF5848]|nr:hypothetical protein [Bacillus sp. HMF5848]
MFNIFKKKESNCCDIKIEEVKDCCEDNKQEEKACCKDDNTACCK